jgi:hypothetical protein
MLNNLPAFGLKVKVDDHPTRSPHLKRFSLIFTQGKNEIVVRGFLLPVDHKQVISPTVVVAGRAYSIAQLSPQMQEAILRQFEFEDLFPVQTQPKSAIAV